MVGPAPGSGSATPGELLQSLAGTLPELVPAELLELEVQRSVRDRMAGRPGRVERVRVLGPELTLALSSMDGRRAVAEAAHVVRGVVISRRTVPLAEWLDLLAEQLRAFASASATDDAAVTRTLAALGVREPASDLNVDPFDLPAGLRALPARLSGRVPDDVRATVERICALLLETLPKVEGDGSQDEHAVRRAATDYLPRTLRGYVALPSGWASGHQLDSGGTALDALREQLGVLEAGLGRIHDAAIKSDAAELLANGIFLADRFASSELDSPEQ
jgi:hypothetical protein